MELQFTKSFEDDYRCLPKEIQKQLDKKLLYLLESLKHPSLRTKKMAGHPSIWEGRVSKGWRFTFEIEGSNFIMRRVGTHDILRKP